MTPRTELELWVAEVFNALGGVVFLAVVVLGMWLWNNWRGQ